MKSLSDLEKKVNSELTTKIKSSKIKHNQLYLSIDSDDLLEVIFQGNTVTVFIIILLRFIYFIF